MPQTDSTRPTPEWARDHADGRSRVASLNADGAQKWFIPPYVIPAFILMLVIAQAVSRT